MPANLSRRGLLAGFASLLAAPVIVRASNLMPVKSISDLTVVTDGAAIWYTPGPVTQLTPQEWEATIESALQSIYRASGVFQGPQTSPSIFDLLQQQ